MSEKVYVVTLRRREDLEQFYTDMSDGGYRLKMKRPISRNTHYYLTDEQAETIRQDSRVLAVELTPDQLGMKPGPMSFYNTAEYNIQGTFDKTGLNQASAANYRQWAHLHSAGNASLGKVNAVAQQANILRIQSLAQLEIQTANGLP